MLLKEKGSTIINKYWLHYICVLFWFALKNMLNSGNTGCTSIPNSCNVHVTFDLGCVSLVVGVFTSQTKYMKKIYIRGRRRRGGGGVLTLFKIADIFCQKKFVVR